MSSDNPEKPFVNILAFHKIQNQFSFGPNNLSPRRFRKLLEYLKGKGYQFVPLKEIIESPAENKIAFTFDDGYAHLLKQLPPLMEEFVFKPTVFIPTHYIGRRNRWDYNYFLQRCYHLNEQQIKELSKNGVEFGSHGHTHTSLLKLSENQIETELAESKRILEDITGYPIDIISYPFGRFDTAIIAHVKEAGYRYGLTMNFPDQNDSGLNLGRYAVYGYDTRRTILSKIKRGKLFLVEKAKARLTNRLSGGTILLNRWRKLK